MLLLCMIVWSLPGPVVRQSLTSCAEIHSIASLKSAAAGGLYNLVTAADRKTLESQGVIEVMRKVPISRYQHCNFEFQIPCNDRRVVFKMQSREKRLCNYWRRNHAESNCTDLRFVQEHQHSPGYQGERQDMMWSSPTQIEKSE